MSLHSCRRTYGSLEDPLNSSRNCASDDVISADPDRDSFDFWRERGQDGGEWKRWFSLVVFGVLAVGGMTMSLSHKVHRVPKITRKTDSAGDSSSPSLIGVSHVDTPQAETSPVAKPLLSFPRVVSSATPPQEEELSQLSFTALNFYHVRDGKPALDYPWLKDVKLVEPHRETTLAVSSPRDGFEYRWEIRGGDPAQTEWRATASGPEAVVVLTLLDDNVITLEEVDTETQTATRRLEEGVMVKYVRREIRTLTDDEREELFDAMYQLWVVRVDGGNGEELYGKGYADIYAINRLHYKAASPIDCDHFHEGLGFLTSHGLLTNTFEYSLQRVNPKLTLPYWDFTIEGSLIGDSGNASSVDLLQHTSPIFQESWFGTFDPIDDMVKDGRWANTKIQPMHGMNPGGVMPDVYGKLRAPWNTNDRPNLSRGMGKMCGSDMSEFYPWPTCESHYNLATSFSDFYSWMWQSMFDPHGPVHIWIGGVMDCEETYQKIENLVGRSAAGTLAAYSFVHRKNLYRDGLFKCEGTAKMDESPEELVSRGQCGCLGYDLTQGYDYEIVYESMMGLDDVIGGHDVDTKRQVVAAICSSTMAIGDHLQAGSSLDPSFWATHPTMERLWMFTVLTGQIADYTWEDSSFTYEDSNGFKVTEDISLYGDTCIGHGGSDVFPYGILDTDTDGFTIKTGIRGNTERGNRLTNREVLEAFHPQTNSLPYVYDTFKWSHCAGDGFDLDDAWGSTQTKTNMRTKRPVFEEGASRPPMYSSIMKLMAENKAKRNGQT